LGSVWAEDWPNGPMIGPMSSRFAAATNAQIAKFDAVRSTRVPGQPRVLCFRFGCAESIASFDRFS
jgi:hypothetical protein